jgi:hypothetical protein
MDQPTLEASATLSYDLDSSIGEVGAQYQRVADVSVAANEDVLWPEKARIRVVGFDGVTGRVEITALPGRTVVCRVQQGGVTVDRATAKGEEIARLDWENAAATVLSLASDDGCELSLPLSG